MKPITLVWNRAIKDVWEEQWIEYLFQNIPHTTIENLDHDKYIDNSVIIDSLRWAPYHNDYIKNLHNKQCNFGIIHLSDETCDDDITSYAHAKFVLRNYYRRELPSYSLTIPLGWNSGFVDIDTNPSIFAREFSWAVVCERWDQNRNFMVSQISNIPKGILYVANTHGPRLSAVEMSKLYRKSIFVPCPRGLFIVDSFRVTEALEAGCIPIVEKNDYWFNMHGKDFPAIQINRWDDVSSLIYSLLQDPKDLENKRLECNKWWKIRKEETLKNVTDLVIEKMQLL